MLLARRYCVGFAFGFFFFSATRISAQTSEPVMMRVTYQLIHVNDTTKREDPLKTEVLLQVGRLISRFDNKNIGPEQKTTTRSNQKVQSKSQKIFVGQPFAVVRTTANNYGCYLQLPQKQQLLRFLTLGMNMVIITSKLPLTDWRVTEEKKVIGGYSCQKAIGVLGGRTYFAWFAIELPFQYGPWKLGGLPGLILEARDSKNEIQFLFKDIKEATADEKIYLPSISAVPMSEESFAAAEKKFMRDPEGIAAAQLGFSGGQSVTLAYRDINGRMLYGIEAKKQLRIDAKKQGNNPIELKNTR